MAGRMLILADDLSGAAECAAACRRAGMTAEVRFEADAAGCEVEALALDLDTRSGPAEAARARTLAARPFVAGRGLYRKIDSTLRGHVGVEIAATLEVAGPEALAIVCPAFPAMGRTVRAGGVFVGDAPLQSSDAWRREGEPAPDLSALLEGVALATARVGLDEVRGLGLGSALAEAKACGARAVVCDAETDADLAAIVAAGLGVPGAVWIGSGGMAVPLARALAPADAGRDHGPARRLGPTLVVVGSAAPRSREQLAALALRPGVRLVRVDPADLLHGMLGQARDAVALTADDAGLRMVAVTIGEQEVGDGAALSAGLGALLAPLLPRFGGLVATGGETARAVLSAAGVAGLLVHGEVEAGVVLSSAGDLPVVTKSGGFGHAGSLIAAVEAIAALA